MAKQKRSKVDLAKLIHSWVDALKKIRAAWRALS